MGAPLSQESGLPFKDFVIAQMLLSAVLQIQFSEVQVEQVAYSRMQTRRLWTSGNQTQDLSVGCRTISPTFRAHINHINNCK